MAEQWYVTMQGQQVGPVSPQQIREMAASGQLQPTDTVWKEGMAQWVPASSLKGLPFRGGAVAPSQGQSPAWQPQQAGYRPAAPSANVSKNFQFDGSAGDFFVTALLAALVTVFTFYIGTPWAICMIQRWHAEHTIVNGRRLKFIGTGGDLFVKFLIGILLTIVTCYIYLFWFIPKIQKWIVEHTDFADA